MSVAQSTDHSGGWRRDWAGHEVDVQSISQEVGQEGACCAADAQLQIGDAAETDRRALGRTGVVIAAGRHSASAGPGGRSTVDVDHRAQEVQEAAGAVGGGRLNRLDALLRVADPADQRSAWCKITSKIRICSMSSRRMSGLNTAKEADPTAGLSSLSLAGDGQGRAWCTDGARRGGARRPIGLLQASAGNAGKTSERQDHRKLESAHVGNLQQHDRRFMHVSQQRTMHTRMHARSSSTGYSPLSSTADAIVGIYEALWTLRTRKLLQLVGRLLTAKMTAAAHRPGIFR